MELIERINDAIELETVGVYIPISDAKLILSTAEDLKTKDDFITYIQQEWQGETDKLYLEIDELIEENKRLREALDRIYIVAQSPSSTENQHHMGRIAIEALNKPDTSKTMEGETPITINPDGYVEKGGEDAV